MCAIGGASFAPGSKVNRPRLVSALLREGEIRGDDAAGYAWVDEDGSDGIYKKPVKGSVLNTSLVPATATSVIIHTRNGTHGSAQDNDNNHPVLSPSGNIRLVHNGVISNHDSVRQALGKEGKSLPDVDSSVIPAVIEKFGIDGTDLLRGYAAAAWFDRETGATIHLAKFHSSPVSYAYLKDGSFVFASTDAILAKALRSIGLEWIGTYPAVFETLREGDYIQLLDGQIIVEGDVDFGATDYSSYGWQNVTDGRGKAPASTSAYTPGSQKPENPAIVPPKVTPTSTAINSAAEAMKNQGKQPVNPSPAKGSEDKAPLALSQGPTYPASHPDDQPLALLSPEAIQDYLDNDGDLMSEEEYDNWVASGLSIEAWERKRAAERDDLDEYDVPTSIFPFGDPDFVEPFEGNLEPRFYATSHDGDYTDYTTLHGLLSALHWQSGVIGGEDHLVGPEEGALRWVNHFSDIGFLSTDGEDDDVEYSWVSSPSNMEPFTGLLPMWVKDGCDKLRKVTVG